MPEKKSLRGYCLITFLIGLGFFTMGLMDPLYDTYVPVFLGKYISSNGLIGAIMTLDNVLAIFLIPIFSALSDRTETRIGRRMPYIITLLPLAAIFFGLMPISSFVGFFALIVCIFLLNISKQAVRGPVVALMPDMVPGDLRSEANGVINTMGGIASILGTVLLARLMDVEAFLLGFGKVSGWLSFPVSSLFVLSSVVLLFVFVKERDSKLKQSEKGEGKEKNEPILKSLSVVMKEKDKSALYILISLFCWFMGYQGVLPFIGKYSIEILGTSPGTASLAAGMVGIAYAIFAIPSGKVAHKVGRKKTIRFSLIALVVVLTFVFLHGVLLSGKQGIITLASFWALLFLFGIFWVSVVTNSFPMLWQMSTYSTVGVYTGLYYFFNQAASILSPPVFGASIDFFGYPSLFLLAAIFMAVAFVLMGKVERGEAEG